MEKLLIELEHGAWHGHSTESVWATHVHGSHYRLENSPFFARGLSFQDIVTVIEQDGMKTVLETTTPSGGSTYRIIPNENTTPEQFEACWKPAQDAGCSYEHGNFGYDIYAVDVPATTDIHTVYAALEEGLRQEIWDFEEGHCGHVID